MKTLIKCTNYLTNSFLNINDTTYINSHDNHLYLIKSKDSIETIKLPFTAMHATLHQDRIYYLCENSVHSSDLDFNDHRLEYFLPFFATEIQSTKNSLIFSGLKCFSIGAKIFLSEQEGTFLVRSFNNRVFVASLTSILVYNSTNLIEAKFDHNIGSPATDMLLIDDKLLLATRDGQLIIFNFQKNSSKTIISSIDDSVTDSMIEDEYFLQDCPSFLVQSNHIVYFSHDKKIAAINISSGQMTTTKVSFQILGICVYQDSLAIVGDNNLLFKDLEELNFCFDFESGFEHSKFD